MKLFKKRIKVFYSCVIDDNPKFYWQGYIFINSLIKLAKVRGSRIFVHMTSRHESFEKFLSKYGVNINFIKPCGDKKYCNKLQQLKTKELQKADFVFFCDADIAITEDLESLVIDKSRILGKVVDFDNPDFETLKSIYNYFKVSYPQVTKDTLNSKATFEINFNGGLYGIPTKFLEDFVKQWKLIAQEMLDSKEIREELGKKIKHVDQISFSLTLQKLKLKYKLLLYEYNCPIHIQDFITLKQHLNTDIKVIHYHSNLSSTGLINVVNVSQIDKCIMKINKVVKENFDNELFWNYRYKTNPSLGSGTGSRGKLANYKLDYLRLLGIEKDESVLDIGCGDLEIVKHLDIRNYIGVDISEEALKIASVKYPKHMFLNVKDKNLISKTHLVLCLDVLIHQQTKEDYEHLIDFISKKAISRVIVSGYEIEDDNSYMCFFYENVKQSLLKTGEFKYVFKIGEYRGLGLYIADKGDLSVKNTENDIDNTTIDNVLDKVNQDLLLESIVISRENFGWYTKHHSRLYEYPWLLKKVGRNLNNLNIADFGAGVTPLPIQLAQRGANVYTVDKHETTYTLDNVKHANEWGFFDYGQISKNIKSYNNLLDESLFKKNTFDIWYSISVVEHLSADLRRSVFKIMRDTLKNNGKIYLTVDLVKDSTYLWNMTENKQVENKEIHGTLKDFEQELKNLDFILEDSLILKMPKDERIDIAMISGTLNRVRDGL